MLHWNQRRVALVRTDSPQFRWWRRLSVRTAVQSRMQGSRSAHRSGALNSLLRSECVRLGSRDRGLTRDQFRSGFSRRRDTFNCGGNLPAIVNLSTPCTVSLIILHVLEFATDANIVHGFLGVHIDRWQEYFLNSLHFVRDGVFLCTSLARSKWQR